MVDIKKSSLSTTYIARPRDAVTYETTVRKGTKDGSGSLSGAAGAIFYYRNPSVTQSNTQAIIVTTQVSVTIDPSTSDQWWGIWAQGVNPSDADVKAGTGALLTSSVAGVADISVVTDTLDPTTLTVNTIYELHWYAEVTGLPAEYRRAPTVSFNLNPSQPTGKPSIDGTLEVLQTLTCNTTSISDPDGIGTYSYQWIAGGVTIPGATSVTYDLTDSEKHKHIQVSVTYTDGNSVPKGPLTSAAYGPVAAYNYPPTGQLLLSGEPVVGKQLTLSRGTVEDGNGLNWPGAITVEWHHVGGGPIGAFSAPGAFSTGTTYIVQESDVGESIEARAHYRDDDGFDNTTDWSNAVGPVGATNTPATGKPTITGSLYVGYPLTAGIGNIDDADGVPDVSTFTWDWKANGVSVGSGDTYVLQSSDGGKKMTVTANFTDLAGGDESCTSAQTTNVLNPTYSEFYHEFTTATKGNFSYTRAGTQDYADHLAATQTAPANVEAYPGAQGTPPAVTDAGVTYGIQLGPDVATSGDLDAVISALGALPPPGLLNNYYCQVQFTLDADMSAATGYLAEMFNTGNNLDAVQVTAISSTEMHLRLKINDNTEDRKLVFTVGALVADDRVSIAFRKSSDDRHGDGGFYGQCRVNGGAPIILTAKNDSVDPDATGDHGQPLDKIDIGSEAATPPSSDMFPATFSSIRIGPFDISDADITAWPVWEHPAPILPAGHIDGDLHYGDLPAHTPPVIDTQPLPLTQTAATIDTSLQVTVVASADGDPVNYDWQSNLNGEYRSIGLDLGASAAGANTDTLSVTGTTLAEGETPPMLFVYHVKCRVYNNGNSTLSESAEIRVNYAE